VNITAAKALEANYRQALDRREVPEHLHDGLIRYLVAGILSPDSFLHAVLSNDLVGTVRKADAVSRAGLFHLLIFLVNDTPPDAWGSPDKVAEWVETLLDTKWTA